MTQFVGLRAKAYSYLIYDDSEDKKPKVCHKKENLSLKKKKKTVYKQLNVIIK